MKSSQKYGLGIQDPEKSYPLSWIRDLRSETLLNGENILTILTIFKSVLLVLSSEDPVNFDNVLVVQLERLQESYVRLHCGKGIGFHFCKSRIIC